MVDLNEQRIYHCTHPSSRGPQLAPPVNTASSIRLHLRTSKFEFTGLYRFGDAIAPQKNKLNLVLMNHAAASVQNQCTTVGVCVLDVPVWDVFLKTNQYLLVP
jgi:hypothetical protein